MQHVDDLLDASIGNAVAALIQESARCPGGGVPIPAMVSQSIHLVLDNFRQEEALSLRASRCTIFSGDGSRTHFCFPH